jgi:hypothetical protein
MSATMTPPPATVDAPAATATKSPARPRVAAGPARSRTQPAVSSSRVSHPNRSTGRLGDSLVFAAWASGLTVAGVVGAIALAFATPIVIGRIVYDERKYR